MFDFEKEMDKIHEEREKERQMFFEKCAEKINDGEMIYRLLGFAVCERFRLDLEYNGEPPYVVWNIVNHFVDNVDEDWDTWLTKDNAPMIRKIYDVKRIFPELSAYEDNEEKIIQTANKLYGLDLHTDGSPCDSPEYMWALEFDFNSFTPLPINEIEELKKEKAILEKYGHSTEEVDKKLSTYNINMEDL